MVCICSVQWYYIISKLQLRISNHMGGGGGGGGGYSTRSIWGTFSHPPTSTRFLGPKLNFCLDIFGFNFQRSVAFPNHCFPTDYDLILSLWNSAQWTEDAKITSWWRQNNVATSFWHHNDVVIASCARWASSTDHFRESSNIVAVL